MPAHRPEAPEHDPLLGQVLGSFRVERVLGRGAMGTVYLGVHALIGRKAAIKVLHRELANTVDCVRRFQDEARAVNRVGNENIVSIHDLNTLPSGQPYLVMEYLEGRPLSALLEAPMSADDLVPLLIQACSGLHAAHLEGVIHRDLKPDNIFVVERGRGGRQVKLLDFGVAKLFEAEGEAAERTAAGVMLGTPAYMAPEQWGSAAVDARSDIYSLGITAWRALVGRLPFKARSMVELMVAHQSELPPAPHQLDRRIPARLSQVVLKAIAKAPEDRHQTAEELMRALEEVQALQPTWVPLQPASPTPPPAPRPSPPAEAIACGPEASLKVHDDSGARARRFEYSQLTRGGVLLHCAPPFPELFHRMRLELPAPGGPLWVQGEVVRHIPPEQAERWGMRAGIALQFVEVPEATRQVLKGWVGPVSGPTPLPALAPAALRPEEFAQTRSLSSEEAWAARVDDFLASWLEREPGNHYQVLKVRPDATFEDLRTSATELIRRVALSSTMMTQTQSKQLKGALQRIREAARTLLDPKQRAAYDAELGNFRGVSLCLAAGLSRAAVEALRQDFVATHPLVAQTAKVALATADPLLAQGMKEVARQLYVRALQQDPLNLELHERVRRAEEPGASAPL